MKNGLTRLRVGINHLLANSFWGYVLLLGVAVVALFAVVAIASLVDREVWWNVYYALGLNPIEGESEHRHLWLYLLLGVCGALVFGGLMVTVFTSGVERYVERTREGRVRYSGLRGHVVVMGWNEMTPSLIVQLGGKWPKSMVVLVTSMPAGEVHDELKARLAEAMLRRVLIYADHPVMTGASLRSLALPAATEVYLTPDGTGTGRQQLVDLALLQDMVRNVDGRRQPLKVKVMIDRFETYTMLQHLELPEAYSRSADGRPVIELRMFNFYENWARLLWSYGSPCHYDPLDFEPVEHGDKRVHLVIVGFGDMGQALLFEALRICHYPGDVVTGITVVDPNADQAERALWRQYPAIDAIGDVRIDFRCATPDEPAMRDDLEAWARDSHQLLTIAICIPEADQAMRMALQLPEAIYCQEGLLRLERTGEARSTLFANASRTRALVRQSADTQFLLDTNALRYPNMRVFGSMARGIDIGLLSDDLAVTINGLYCDNMMGATVATDDGANRERWNRLWLDATEASRNASRYQADRFRSLVAILHRHPAGERDELVERLSESEHRRWIAERVLAGWRPAPVRVDALRLHNSIVPYADLAEEEKQKDRNVIAFAATL